MVFLFWLILHSYYFNNITIFIKSQQLGRLAAGGKQGATLQPRYLSWRQNCRKSIRLAEGVAQALGQLHKGNFEGVVRVYGDSLKDMPVKGVVPLGPIDERFHLPKPHLW